MNHALTPTGTETGPELVSAVIPTHNRPELVVKAVRSALRQTHPSIEVVVVIDGEDPRTEASLSQIQDPRLRVVALAAMSEEQKPETSVSAPPAAAGSPFSTTMTMAPA